MKSPFCDDPFFGWHSFFTFTICCFVLFWTFRMKSFALSSIANISRLMNEIHLNRNDCCSTPNIRNIRYDKWKSAFHLNSVLWIECNCILSHFTWVLHTYRKCQPYEMCWIFVFSLKCSSTHYFSLSHKHTQQNICSIQYSKNCFIWNSHFLTQKDFEESPNFYYPIFDSFKCVLQTSSWVFSKRRPLFEHLSMADFV